MLRAAALSEVHEGWRISGWGPEGEGVEAIGPEGQRAVSPTWEGIAKAIKEASR